VVSSSLLGGVVGWGGAGGGQPQRAGRGLSSGGDAAVDDLVTDADDQAAEDARVDGHLQAVAAVEAAEQAAAALLRRGQRPRPWSPPTDRPRGWRLGQPLDRSPRADGGGEGCAAATR
jgi:hypothetical protein